MSALAAALRHDDGLQSLRDAVAGIFFLHLASAYVTVRPMQRRRRYALLTLDVLIGVAMVTVVMWDFF